MVDVPRINVQVNGTLLFFKVFLRNWGIQYEFIKVTPITSNITRYRLLHMVELRIRKEEMMVTAKPGAKMEFHTLVSRLANSGLPVVPAPGAAAAAPVAGVCPVPPLGSVTGRGSSPAAGAGSGAGASSVCALELRNISHQVVPLSFN